MPRWFPEVPDHEFLSFREVCKMLPVDAQKYLVRANKLGEHRLDGGLQPYVQRPRSDVPTGYESGLVPDLRHADPALLYEHSQVTIDDYREGRITVTLWFVRQWVEHFGNIWEPMPHLAQDTDPLPWESKPKRRGPKGVRWRAVLKEATAAKGRQLTPEEAPDAIRAGGVKVVETKTGFSFDGVTVATGTFRNALRDAAKK